MRTLLGITLIALTACSTSPSFSPLAGTWGGTHLTVVAAAYSTTATLPCLRADLPGPLFPDHNGAINVTGSALDSDARTSTAFFSAHLAGDRLAVQLVTGYQGQDTVRDELTYGHTAPTGGIVCPV